MEAYCSTLYHKCPSRADHEQRYDLLTACGEKVSPPMAGGFLTDEPPSLTLRRVKTAADQDQVAVHVRRSDGCFTAYHLWTDDKDQLRCNKQRSSGKSPTHTGELLKIGISPSTDSEPASSRQPPQASKRRVSSVPSAAKKRQSTTGVVELVTPDAAHAAHAAHANVTEVSASLWNSYSVIGGTRVCLAERQNLW